MNKKEIVFSDLKDFDIEQISTEVINEVKAMIYEKYKELGGNERVAKSSTFINEIDAMFEF